MTQVLRSGVERKIGALGRIVIPSEIRQLLQLAEGDPLTIEIRDGSIVLSPLSEQCPACGMPVPGHAPARELVGAGATAAE